jgi:hypothetical protein
MQSSAPQAAHSFFSKPRIFLLATVAGLGVGAILSDHGLAPRSPG